MNYCPKCGASIDNDGILFCPKCGFRLMAQDSPENINEPQKNAQVNVEQPVNNFVDQQQESDNQTFVKSRDNTWIEKSFSASALLFWIKGKISVDYRFVRVNEKNTIWGIFPAGSNTQNIPLKNISNVALNTAYKMSRFLWGILLAVIGIAFIQDSPLVGLILLALGILIFLCGILTQVEIERSGTAYSFEVPFFNKADMQEVQHVIEEALSTDADKTDQSLYHHRLNEQSMDDVQ